MALGCGFYAGIVTYITLLAQDHAKSVMILRGSRASKRISRIRGSARWILRQNIIPCILRTNSDVGHTIGHWSNLIIGTFFACILDNANLAWHGWHDYCLCISYTYPQSYPQKAVTYTFG